MIDMEINSKILNKTPWGQSEVPTKDMTETATKVNAHEISRISEAKITERDLSGSQYNGMLTSARIGGKYNELMTHRSDIRTACLNQVQDLKRDVAKYKKLYQQKTNELGTVVKKFDIHRDRTDKGGGETKDQKNRIESQ